MADEKKPEKKSKRAYLDDFEKDLNGNYQYRGAHYRYAGSTPRAKLLAQLWGLCGVSAALTVAAGVLPGATADAPLYLLLPYMAALVAALYTVVLLARLTHGGDPMRAYIYEQTVQKLPSLAGLAAVLCGLAALGQGIALFAGGGQTTMPVKCVFILFQAIAFAADAAAAHIIKGAPYTREE